MLAMLIRNRMCSLFSKDQNREHILFLWKMLAMLNRCLIFSE